MFAGKKIAFIGGGKMGSILVRGMIRRRIAPSKSITVTDIDQPRLKELATSLKVQVSRDNKKAVQEADIIVLAVKPQQFEQLRQIQTNEGFRSMSHLVDRALIEFLEKRRKN